MIVKFLKIKNVGKFRDYSASCDTDFRKMTLVFSENARGKSTLTSILRSLTNGDTAPLIARKTLGSAEDSRIEIRAGSDTYKFNGKSWSATFPNIEIFDSTFVDDHVYSGSTVDHSHKKRLYQFAIGEEAVKIAKSVVALDETSRTAASLRKDAEAEVTKLIQGKMTVEQFVKLEIDPTVDEKIAKAEKQIEALSKSTSIVEQPNLSELLIPELETEELLELLSESLGSLSQGAMDATRKHIDHRMDDRGEQWVSQGLEYVQDDHCPFCGQSLEGVELVDAYRAYFDRAYTDLIARIDLVSQKVSSVLNDAKAVNIRKTSETNEARAMTWRSYVETAFPNVNVETIEDIVSSCRALVDEQLSKKRSSPLTPIEPTTALTQALATMGSVVSKLEQYNEQVRTANEAINARKTALGVGNIHAEKQQLQLLQNVKARHSDDGKRACTVFKAASDAKDLVETQKAETKERLEEQTQDLLKSYEERINHFLGCFGATFKVAETKQSMIGGSPSSSYRLVINGVAVDIGDSKTASHEPCFKTVLSDGDKSTLAFAFFMAKLERDPNLSQKIVVMDDPISSLDGHRKDCTQLEICRVARSATQIVVLSHDPLFLKSIWVGCSLPKRALWIHPKTGESFISEWQIESATMGDYFKRVRAIQSYATGTWNGEDMYVAQSMRVVLEGNLRMRFIDVFDDRWWLGQFIDKIRDSQPGEPLHVMQAKLKELEDINDFSKQYHHDQYGQGLTGSISQVALQTFCKRTIPILAGA